MNRVTAVAVTLATAAAATMAAAATIVPAMAAPRPAAQPATQAKVAATAQRAKATILPTQIASDLDGGKYITVVTCRGADSPPPIQLGQPGKPLTVSGSGPSAAVFQVLSQHDPYKNIYSCTVLVKEKVPAVPKRVAAHKRGCEIVTAARSWTCTRKVTLNTGFGGLARQVKNHHPAG